MASSRNPLVIACLPAWNAADFIDATLESLAAQTYNNLQVLISVDLSNDDTAERCETFARHHPRFRVIRQNKRLGWIGNVNDLLSRAHGDYCVFAFHDDVFEPSYVSRLVACLEARPSAILAYTDMDTLFADGTYVVNRSPNFEGTANRVERASLIIRRDADWWTPHRGLFRLSAAQRTGGLKRHLAGEFAADWPWLVSLALIGDFVRVPEILCHKRFMRESLSQTWRHRRHGTLRWLCASLSVAREVWRAQVRTEEKLQLWRNLFIEIRKLIMPRIRNRLRTSKFFFGFD